MCVHVYNLMYIFVFQIVLQENNTINFALSADTYFYKISKIYSNLYVF